ncbi:MAG: alpha-glucosidase/alpha-galactosidase [Clostridiaceae bacterium]|nr:alpha-glucosidase/alpha-galactosidase [Clostridiaceae bacterium]
MKITFLGAGSSVFVRNVIGDSMHVPSLREAEVALYDIDPQRLNESRRMLENLQRNTPGAAMRFATYCGEENLREALRDADFAVCAIQVGGYEPSTVIDFEVPKRFGLRQTIGDTLGVGGIFRGLRTLPAMELFLRTMAEVCPRVIFLNYTNPMAILTGYARRYHDSVQMTGLCHSVQVCGPALVTGLGLEWDDTIQTKIAGINHMAWLLEISRNGVDLYPELKRLSLERGAPDHDRVRHKIMHTFGYYITESSEHLSEYLPWFIRNDYPELIEEYNIPLDEYPRRCVRQIEHWRHIAGDLVDNPELTHTRSNEYASYIMDAVATNRPFKFGGNVLNTGLITNLPREACVEVPCLVDASGIAPTYIGDLPEQLAALNRTNINVQLLTIEAYVRRSREAVYQAALLDPHTAAQLDIDTTVKLCDALIEAHGNMLPELR